MSVTFSVSASLSLSKSAWKKQNETKPNKTKTDLAESKPQITMETREVLVCVCFPVRCCREIHPPCVAAKYVNSSNVDGQRNHQQGPHKIVGKQLKSEMTLLADPAQPLVNWVGSAPCQLGDESPVNSETWNLNEGKRAARVKETDDVTPPHRAFGEGPSSPSTSLGKQCCN